MRMKKQLRKMSSSSIMHHPQAAPAAAIATTTTTTTSVDTKAVERERRTSTNSDSSVEPMEISHHTTTSASDANNSSLHASKSQHSSEDEEDDQNNNNNNPLKKLYIKSRRVLVNGHTTGRRSDEDADAEEDDKQQQQQQYTASWRRAAEKEAAGNYLTILRKKGRYSSSNSRGASGTAPEEKWNGKDEFEAAIQQQNNASPADVTCRICSKVFASAPLLMTHIVMVHSSQQQQPTTTTTTSPMACHICQMPFSSAANLHKHLRKVHHTTTDEDEGAVSTDSSASGSSHNNNNKRKSVDDLNEEEDEAEEAVSEAIMGSDGRIVVRKRKMRTINNNDVLAANNNLPTQPKYCCPACDRNDFPTMASVETHLDDDHPNIVPKCRHCCTTFKSHRLLNGHRCTAQTLASSRTLGRSQQITQGFKDLTFVDFSSNKFPYIAKSICEQSIRTPIAEQKFECGRCYRAFPCEAALNIHLADCAGHAPSAMNMSLTSDGSHEGGHHKRRLSHDGSSEGELKRDDFFANLDLQNKSIASSNNNNTQLNSSSGQFSPNSGSSNSSAPTSPLLNGCHAGLAAVNKHIHSKFQQGMDFGRLPFDMRNGGAKDLADIESIINVTSGGRFFKHLDHSATTTTTTGSSSNKSVDLNSSLNSSKDQEEEAQDMFTSEFRRMKLRGEFPCKLCTAVYPNLRALKGHNRVHLSAAGSGPYRCNMCPYSIHDKAALIRHMRTHNGDRPYECALCNYAFTTKANCERHLRNRHAKATRDEIKRAIIYHPSEDSSCDDPHKKMAMFAATDFGAAPLPDPELLHHSHHHRDHSRESKENRTSTPVSHLKEMLMPSMLSSPTMVPLLPKHSSSPLSLAQQQQQQQHQQQMQKIQVKSLEKLIKNEEHRGDVEAPALDLTKKVEEEEAEEAEKVRREHRAATSPLPSAANHQMAAAAAAAMAAAATGMPFMDMALLKKQEELLLAQQQLFKDAMPKMGPAQYFQELYRNLLFPGAFPLFPFFGAANGAVPTPGTDDANPLLAPNTTTTSHPMLDLKHFMQPSKETPVAAAAANPLMSGGSALLNPAAFFSPNSMLPNQLAQTPTQQPLKPQMKSPEIPNDIMKSLNIPGTPTGASQGGSVKMVIKNGVLIPKQKQRRYRTERPFACEHCSARFTLRSNMERHIKQQHPQYWAQRQRSGHQLLRRSHGAASVSPSSGMPTMLSPGGAAMAANPFSNLSEEMKFLLQLNRDQKMPFPFDAARFQEELERRRGEHAAEKDDLDEENEEDMMDEEEEEEEDAQLVIDEDSQDAEPEPSANNKDEGIMAAKKVAESILEQAMKKNLGETNNNNNSSGGAEKEEDLASITKLVDNARAGNMFNNFFRSDRAASTEQSDEEGLVASGSASEENQSGAEDHVSGSSDHNKKKSAYSLAPNRVACPYCQRMFPWTSSLRRHILTHTGQKPFKCSHCPLLFTTKSNCDRHLLRKHGNVESAQSLYMPIEENEDMPEPTPIKADAVAPNLPALIPVSQLRSSGPAVPVKEEAEDHDEDEEEDEEEDEDEEQEAAAAAEAENEPPKIVSTTVDPAIPSISVNQLKNVEGGNFIASDMPFKCHLCDSSFPERLNCLEHIKVNHNTDYERLVANGSIEMDANAIFSESAEDEKKADGKGKYPDYANRKVICAFCVRRFWSAEDLRRHMRTHSGERPFQCDVCSRKFTLKHSMLRHQKKHQRRSGVTTQSCSDMSDEEVHQQNGNSRKTSPADGEKVANGKEAADEVATIPQNSADFLNDLKKRSKLNLANTTILGMLMNRGREQADGEVACDFLANMLGIGDQGLLAKAFQSPEEAAKLLGVEK